MGRQVLSAVAVALGAARIAGAQNEVVMPGAVPESVVVTPGPAYDASGLHRFFFGDHYRDLWTTPIRVELLDLHHFAGGLTPLKRGGGQQTRSLRFNGADGRQYQFRSLDKDPSPLLPEALRRTLARRILQDQISAGHPGAALVVSPLLEAAGVLHAKPQLRVMPDDPVLGEFRAEFGGMLGTIEERPRGEKDDRPGFADATTVENTVELFERLEKDQDERVDTRAYLSARLVDLFLGDWDRHQDQWGTASPGRRFRATATRRSPGSTARSSTSPGSPTRNSSSSHRATRACSASPGTRGWWTAGCSPASSGRCGTRSRPRCASGSPMM
jgi:hypothetical protein